MGRAKYNRTTPEQIDRINRYASMGMPLKQICKNVGIGIYTVSKITTVYWEEKMKNKVAVLLFIFMSLSGYAQDKRFTFFGRTELADKYTHNDKFDYGFNLGAGVEYQMTILYFNAETYWFPGLNDLDYLHFQGTILGLNHHTFDDKWRFAIGLLRPGFILRDGGPHALFGADAGIERYFNDVFIGFKGGLDKKGDSKIWGEESHTVWHLSLKFGIVL